MPQKKGATASPSSRRQKVRSLCSVRPVEFVRQLVESNGFYFLEKDKRGDKKIVENILYVGAMSHPGGGRNDIPDRLKRHFFTFNLTPPSQQSTISVLGVHSRNPPQAGAEAAAPV